MSAIAAAGFLPGRLERLLEALRAEIDRGWLPGCVVCVARHGRVALLEALGQQDPQRGIAMPVDAIFRVYSMTKPVVSLAAMMLVERGALMLHHPVGRYVPAFAFAPGMLLHDLLRHTAGLTYEWEEREIDRLYLAARVGDRARDNAAFCETLGKLPLASEPGSRWEYSRATDVLGRVIEVAGGMPLGAFLQRNILGPLRMVDTAFSVPAAKHGRIAEPFARDPESDEEITVLEVRDAPRFESGGGGLVSTAADYARFLQCMLDGGELEGVRLVGPRTVAHMTADHLGPRPRAGDLLPEGHGFGLGFAVRLQAGMAATPGSAGMYYWGGLAGTTFFVDPQAHLHATLMVQAPNQRDHCRALLRNLVYAALAD